MSKVALQLNHPNFTADQRTYPIYCCDFHGCRYGSKHMGGREFCASKAAYNASYELRFSKAGRGADYDAVVLYHYARSLEKYDLKGNTWETATGENAVSYPITNYLQRSVGWTLDRSILRHACQLRELLTKRTGEAMYLRPGDVWMRNVEFGKNLSYPGKMKRLNQPIPPNFKYEPENPYPYQTKETTTVEVEQQL
jgi:hypothetical protein